MEIFGGEEIMAEKMVKYKYKKPTKPIVLDDSKTKPPYQAVNKEENGGKKNGRKEK